LPVAGCVALLALAAARLSAQTPAAALVDSARVEIDRATAANDTARLSNAVRQLDRGLGAFPGDPYVLHYRGYAAYRQSIEHFRTNDLKSAAATLARAMNDLTASGEKLAWPETFALLSSVAGMTIGVDQSRMMELGMQIAPLQSRALELGPKNPRVALIIGEGLVNTPVEYGGGADRARELIARAISLFGSDAPGPLAPAWGREEAERQLKALGGAKSP
jgi:hypothetical protein